MRCIKGWRKLPSALTKSSQGNCFCLPGLDKSIDLSHCSLGFLRASSQLFCTNISQFWAQVIERRLSAIIWEKNLSPTSLLSPELLLSTQLKRRNVPFYIKHPSFSDTVPVVPLRLHDYTTKGHWLMPSSPFQTLLSPCIPFNDVHVPSSQPALLPPSAHNQNVPKPLEMVQAIMDRIAATYSYVICRPLCKKKMWAPCSKIRKKEPYVDFVMPWVMGEL